MLDSCNVTVEDLARIAKYSEVLDMVFSSLVLFYLVLEIKRRYVAYFSFLWISDLWDWNKKEPLGWRGCWLLAGICRKMTFDLFGSLIDTQC